MRVLLVEDDLSLGSSLARVLRQESLPALWVRSCAEARQFLGSESFDLMLLDIVLPDGSGLDVLTWLRARQMDVPVMMLTARDSVSDRVTGLDAGADDYLPKPFAMEELLSRIRVLLRRRGKQLSAVWSVGSLSIDTARRKVALDDQPVSLSSREYSILAVLAADPGRVMTRLEIESSLSLTDGTESNTLDVHIYNLRRKIGADRISTVRGVGYALESV
jgi:DNA-binding response OmpR family regulator